MAIIIRNLGVIFVLIFLFRPGHLRAEIAYIYDESGRLTGIIDPSGESAVYRYDAVGNLLSITRRKDAKPFDFNFSSVIGAGLGGYGSTKIGQFFANGVARAGWGQFAQNAIGAWSGVTPSTLGGMMGNAIGDATGF